MATLLLETDRLVIRPKSLCDFDRECLMDSDAIVRRFTGGVASKETTRRYFEENLSILSRTGFGYFAITVKPDEKMIGWVCLKRSDILDDFEIGYQLAFDYWGRGIATEAARAVLHYAFVEKQLAVVWAIINPANIASARVIQKLDFIFDRQAFNESDQAMLDVYRLDRDNFKPS